MCLRTPASMAPRAGGCKPEWECIPMLYLEKELIGAVDRRLGYYTEYTPRAVADAVQRIRTGEIVGAIFKRALAPELCAYASAKLDECAEKERYEGAEDVGRVGGSAYECQHGARFKARYFSKANAWLDLSRSIVPGGAYPLDQLRLWLDDWWSGKVHRLKLEEGVSSLGLIRYLASAAAILPHNDALAADMPDSLIAQQIDIQIAINFMLQRSDQGGATRIYPKRPTRNEYEANRRAPPHDYALKDEWLPANPVIIRAEPGDAYFFDASFPHSVDACEGGEPRYTLSAFVGVTRTGDLALFS